jgi:membrane protease YdiL (CAAX protease family)
VEERELAVPAPEVPVPAGPAVPTTLRVRPFSPWLAIVEVIAVSGVPTQLLIAVVLMFGTNMRAFDETAQGFTLEFLATVMLLDTALVALLIRVFLELGGEDSRTVFVGRRPVWGEMWRGLALLPVALVGVTAVVLGLRALVPSLHTVITNPMEQYMRHPFDGAIFVVVVVLGGGVKEELQRAFILHRFDQALGGLKVGLAVTSVIFGLLHITQGIDAAVGIGLLGFFWGWLYMRRRSAVMSIVNHAGFDAVQVIQGVLARTLGA